MSITISRLNSSVGECFFQSISSEPSWQYIVHKNMAPSMQVLEKYLYLSYPSGTHFISTDPIQTFCVIVNNIHMTWEQMKWQHIVVLHKSKINSKYFSISWKHYFGLNPLETVVNGSSLVTELTNISDYLLLVYQTALLEPLNNYLQEKGMLSLLLALFSDNINLPNLNQRMID